MISNIDDNTFVTREIESSEKFSKDKDSEYHSIKLINKLPKFIYGSSNEYPIKINYYFIIIFYSSEEEIVMLRVPIRAIPIHYAEEIYEKTESPTNPFSDEYILEVSRRLHNPNFHEYFKEIVGEKSILSNTKGILNNHR